MIDTKEGKKQALESQGFVKVEDGLYCKDWQGANILFENWERTDERGRKATVQMVARGDRYTSYTAFKSNGTQKTRSAISDKQFASWLSQIVHFN